MHLGADCCLMLPTVLEEPSMRGEGRRG
jgi:hypothetical protein